MHASEYLTNAEAAAALGVHPNHLAKLAARGEVTAALKGAGLRGPRFFHRDEVARVVAQRSQS